MLEGADICYTTHVAPAGTLLLFDFVLLSTSFFSLSLPSFLNLIVAFLSEFASEAQLNAFF